LIVNQLVVRFFRFHFHYLLASDFIHVYAVCPLPIPPFERR
jgi:hypothetical protein